MIFFINLFFLSSMILESCNQPVGSIKKNEAAYKTEVVSAPVPAAHKLETYLSKLKGKRVGMVVNQTSSLGNIHLVDTLLKHKINIVKIYSPEHGFRGEADAGEKVNSAIDEGTGIMMVSLYGEKRKPGPDDLKDIDIMVFDIQDIGVRFYTYNATMTLVMEACAENKIPLMILDRPNPNGYYVDGPVMKKEFQGFLGLHAVPIVYGMTLGEYAQMVNGEGWLKNGIKCDLTVIPCKNYDHTMTYDLPVKPSPNIVSHRAVLLYPSTCLFEGTHCSEGRGTEQPFVIFGHPKYTEGDFTFTPVPRPGAKSSKLYNQLCHGHNLSNLSITEIMSWKRINLSYLLRFYNNMKDKDPFFLANNFLNKLAGNTELMAMIKAGKQEEEIRASWKPELDVFKKTRKKYLLYTDFE